MALFVDPLTIQMAIIIIANAVAVSLLISIKSALNIDRLKAHGLVLASLAVPSLVLALFTSAIWPLPGSYNIIYGDAFLLFSVVLLSAGLLLYYVPRQYPVISVPLLFAGLFSIIYGASVYANSLSSEPLLAGAFFALEGLAAASTAYAIMRKNPMFTNIAIFLFVLATLAVAVIDVPAIFAHATSFAKWVPG
ncbi:MAG: DUF981 family protein [Candidatus Micrarchaeota archaeon]|nr:DUF981 family protein [Candidatus Micrarchaeota archaeon]MDE1823916.1 DUF981 family protein [Candidatus Micrarchaeota archaeon]MDE1849330.1 DUF981 family protein [Candidatus Micrarchaeota archaeon]